MKNLRTRYNRFIFKHRDKGIPNLMLYIVIGTAAVTILDYLLGNSYLLYSYLCFDKSLILKGQVWRLITHIFTEYSYYNPFLSVIFLYFFYQLGRRVEQSMGTLRFNLFYFSGVLMMDIFAMIFCPSVPIRQIYGNMAWYLHLSILLMFAVTNPDAKFLVLFFIPVSAWFMGLVYVGFISFDIILLRSLFPHNLFPLIGLLNFLLFAGKDVLNLFPFIRIRHKAPKKKKETGSIPFHGQKPATQVRNYNHRCTICGRTDVTAPQLEFRYCSRCNGYYCYCEDHINNHTHIE